MAPLATLNRLKDGDRAIVRDIKGGIGISRRLNRLGIHVSDKITVKRSGYLGGPVLISVHGIELGIGHGMAEKIDVEVIP